MQLPAERADLDCHVDGDGPLAAIGIVKSASIFELLGGGDRGDLLLFGHQYRR